MELSCSISVIPTLRDTGSQCGTDPSRHDPPCLPHVSLGAMRLAQNFRFAFDFTLSTQDWTSMLGLLCWFDHGEENHPFSFSSLGIGLCTLYGPHICTLEACLSGCTAFARSIFTTVNVCIMHAVHSAPHACRVFQILIPFQGQG